MPVEEFQRLVPDFDIFMPSMGSMAPYNILFILLQGISCPMQHFSSINSRLVQKRMLRVAAHAHGNPLPIIHAPACDRIQQRATLEQVAKYENSNQQI